MTTYAKAWVAGAFSFFSLLPFAVADDSAELTITADRFTQSLREASTAVTVITSDDIDASGKKTVSEILETVPGLDVVTSGGFGGNSAVFLRGANSEHTLVLLDGMELNDPISPTRAFNFAFLPTELIDRIEIVRGPQSTIYGSDALGGVILIYTKRGKGAPQGDISVEGGSYGTFIEQGTVHGGDDLLQYSLGALRRDMSGFSSASSRAGNSEEDGASNSDVTGRVTLSPSKLFDISAVSKFNRGITELDNTGGVGGDDPNREIDSDNFYSRLEANGHFFEDYFNPKAGVTFTDQGFDDNNFPDTAHPIDSLISSYNGKLLKFDLVNEIKVTDDLQVIVGAETKEEKGSSTIESNSIFGPFTEIFDDKQVRNNGYFTQGRFAVEKFLILNGGIRVDSHSKFGSETTWKAGPVLLIEDTKISGNFGSGFKAPSLFQLYSSFGNQDLDAETSKGWDIGIEQQLFEKRASASVTFFRNTFDDLITFNPQTFKSENIASARTYGIESTVTYKPCSSIEFKGSYTFTDTEDTTTNLDLLRRPRHKGTVSIRWNASERLALDAEINIKGKRFDNDFSTFPSTTTILAGYSTVDLQATYSIQNNWEVIGRVENALDKNYEDVLGFGTSGVAGYGGVRYRF